MRGVLLGVIQHVGEIAEVRFPAARGRIGDDPGEVPAHHDVVGRVVLDVDPVRGEADREVGHEPLHGEVAQTLRISGLVIQSRSDQQSDVLEHPVVVGAGIEVGSAQQRDVAVDHLPQHRVLRLVEHVAVVVTKGHQVHRPLRGGLVVERHRSLRIGEFPP